MNQDVLRDRVMAVVSWLIQQGRAESRKDLAAQMGYKESSLSQIVNGHVAVSTRFVGRLCSMDEHLNREWVMTGKGQMIRQNTFDGTTEVIDDALGRYFNKNTKGARFYLKDDRLFMTVRHVPYACYGRYANESESLEPDNEEWGEESYEVDHVARGTYLSFEVKGDSMDNGLRDSFQSGDRVLVRELEKQFWRDPIRFHDRPYWVVVFGSSVLIKQIIAHDPVEGLITFHSLNPSPEYNDFTLHDYEIRNLYYVVKRKPREVNY